MPVRHGKSELVSKWLPVWYLNHWPDARVIVASYEANFARRWGRQARDIAVEHSRHLMFGVNQNASAANDWDTTAGGGMFTCGVAGPITGRGADLLIVDDPVKSWEQANSEVYREKTWEWWTNTAYNRLEPSGTAIVMMARWHHDDLVGRIVKNAKEPWQVVEVPAVAMENDPLCRVQGQALWPERFNEQNLARIRDQVKDRSFNALFQQNPTPEEGGLFKSDWFRYYRVTSDGSFVMSNDPAPPRVYRRQHFKSFFTVDLALSMKLESSYSVIAHWLQIGSDILLHDLWRLRAEAPTVKRKLMECYKSCNPMFVGVEDKHYGMEVNQSFREIGMPVKPLKADTDKVTRSIPAQIHMQNGRIWLRSDAPWLSAYTDEMLSFPLGSNDDQVDVTSYAAKIVNEYCGPWVKPDRIVSESFTTGFNRIMAG